MPRRWKLLCNLLDLRPEPEVSRGFRIGSPANLLRAVVAVRVVIVTLIGSEARVRVPRVRGVRRVMAVTEELMLLMTPLPLLLRTVSVTVVESFVPNIKMVAIVKCALCAESPRRNTRMVSIANLRPEPEVAEAVMVAMGRFFMLLRRTVLSLVLRVRAAKTTKAETEVERGQLMGVRFLWPLVTLRAR